MGSSFFLPGFLSCVCAELGGRVDGDSILVPFMDDSWVRVRAEVDGGSVYLYCGLTLVGSWACGVDVREAVSALRVFLAGCAGVSP